MWVCLFIQFATQESAHAHSWVNSILIYTFPSVGEANKHTPLMFYLNQTPVEAHSHQLGLISTPLCYRSTHVGFSNWVCLSVQPATVQVPAAWTGRVTWSPAMVCVAVVSKVTSVTGVNQATSTTRSASVSSALLYSPSRQSLVTLWVPNRVLSKNTLLVSSVRLQSSRLSAWSLRRCGSLSVQSGVSGSSVWTVQIWIPLLP